MVSRRHCYSKTFGINSLDDPLAVGAFFALVLGRDNPWPGASSSRKHDTLMSGRDRRIHQRVSLQDLSTPALVRIPNRPPISLVDLSPGGALIDLPFQVRPDSRVTLEFRAASERMNLPFRLLRCYVTIAARRRAVSGSRGIRAAVRMEATPRRFCGAGDFQPAHRDARGVSAHTARHRAMSWNSIP